MVDSGADECVFPATPADFSSPRSLDLIAANGSAIKTFGKRTLLVSFAPNHYIQHSFWIATVSRPILGADFFSSHGIVIDIANKRLSSAMGSFEAEYTSNTAVFGLRLPEDCFEALLESFPEILEQNFGNPVKHRVRHHIVTSGPPLHALGAWMAKS